jgi:hypothetical protein
MLPPRRRSTSCSATPGPVENAANGDKASLVLPAGEIAGAQVAPTGGDPIADVPTVTLAAGTNLIVYAVGSLEARPSRSSPRRSRSPRRRASEGASEDGAAEGDGTPAPTEVNTGGEVASTSTSASLALFAAAAGLFAVAGGAVVLRRRTVDA